MWDTTSGLPVGANTPWPEMPRTYFEWYITHILTVVVSNPEVEVVVGWSGETMWTGRSPDVEFLGLRGDERLLIRCIQRPV